MPPKRKTTVRDIPPAPGDLRLVQAFLNTADREAGTDLLASPQGLEGWLMQHDLLAAGDALTAADLERALALREALRRLLAAGPRAGHELAGELNALASEARLRAWFAAGGDVRLLPASPGLDGVFARLFAILATAREGDVLRRLKVCGVSTCRAVFYDRSRALQGLWCRPVCGSRLRARARGVRQRRRRVTW